mmetsp:Transcript_10335/g.15860  ORF Transcript_10335/g.15860 Transcript_10335/m.15860 type:complete len:246 (+) Transcript_10335:196-933(+)
MGHLTPKHIYKNWKKVTTLLPMDFSVKNEKSEMVDVQGLLIADKVGEVYFLNINNLPRLAANPDDVPGRNQEEADTYDFVAKLVYGHQQTCIHLARSSCGRYTFSVDTLNKIIVNNFPNMFNLQSVSTEHQSEIKDLLQLGPNIVSQGSNGLLVTSSLETGETVHRTQLNSSDKFVGMLATGSGLEVFSKNLKEELQVTSVKDGIAGDTKEYQFESKGFTDMAVGVEIASGKRFKLEGTYDKKEG